MILNPEMLPKVRSRALMDECQFMPCELRIASFFGQACAPQATVVGCHIPHTIGKAVASKVSDLYVAAGCHVCHRLLDMVDKRGISLAEMPEFWIQVMRANHATQARWLGAGIVTVKGGKII